MLATGYLAPLESVFVQTGHWVPFWLFGQQYQSTEA